MSKRQNWCSFEAVHFEGITGVHREEGKSVSNCTVSLISKLDLRRGAKILTACFQGAPSDQGHSWRTLQGDQLDPEKMQKKLLLHLILGDGKLS